ncbi:MAG: T9SS type B sorting domain-containing protein [Bacteroidota bacterium]
MRDFLSLLLFAFFSISAFAQPANDDCDGVIDLGPTPACNTDVIYNNVGATASDIGFGNSPACFNGGTTQNDVWFAFQMTPEIQDITITVIGALGGPNGPISNPQIALYRGDCTFDGLAELACNNADNGDAQVQLDILGLTPGLTYFIRVNDFSATAAPNWGDFTICIDEFVPAINIGSIPNTTSCFGTLYDSGGLEGDYGDDENFTFEICPADAHSCINLDLVDFAIEEGADVLNVYQGEGTDGNLIASATGFSNGNDFSIQAPSGCVTVEFISDGSVVEAGFELTWQCSPLACDGVGVDNPTVINNVPFSGSFSTCDGAATFATSNCTDDAFLGGPEYVFTYDAPGGFCASVNVTNGGVLVLNGPPNDPATLCVGQSETGSIASVDFEEAGTYYIVVANATGCVDFDISVEEADCVLSPALVDALCNPLNGCIEPSGLPSIFTFENNFQDVDMIIDQNAGCWFGVGAEPDFFWFSIEAQADGPFGFILESADNPSDIDFNVWGPFTPEEVCSTPAAVVDFITNNQPIRSSYAGGTEPTGLADTHPAFGYEVGDEYDCDPDNGDNDDIVQTIPAQAGEVYVVLVNDWGDNIGDAGISVDWGPTQEQVLAPISAEILGTDTAICAGQSVIVEVSTTIGSVSWIGETEGLSCINCATPTVTPTETTTYTALIDAICYTDTLDIEVAVFDVTAGPDQQVCVNEEIQIIAGSTFPNATYQWTAPTGVDLSCTNCPDPMVTAAAAGTYEVEVALVTDLCTLTDVVSITVTPGEVPEYNIIDDLQICAGDSIAIGGNAIAGSAYTWTADNFSSETANPVVSPTETTTYFLSVLGDDLAACPTGTQDSITVEVIQLPILDIAGDLSACQGDSILLSTTTPETGVVYSWTGPDDIVDPTDPNSAGFPQTDGTFVLTASRDFCSTIDSFSVDITPILIELNQPDTVRICRGDEVEIGAFVVPAGEIAMWTPGDGSLDTTMANQVIASPETITSYIASVEVPGCMRFDTLTVVVDSLPTVQNINPMDTTICEGIQVLLTSPIYDPADFPDITFQWSPNNGSFDTPDSLYNMVIVGVDSTLFERVATSGVCRDTFRAQVNVNPLPMVTIDPVQDICAGESVQLTATSSIFPDSIMWMPNGSLSCSECLDPVATPGDTTVYNLTVVANQCIGSASITVNAATLPQLQLNSDQVSCLGDPVQLGFLDDGRSTYSWSSSTDPGFSSSDPLLSVSPTETTTYFLDATNACGTLSDSVTVSIVPPVIIEVSEDQTICDGEEVVLSLSNNAPDFVTGTITWSWPDGTDTGAEITVTPSDTTTYTVVYDNGCETLTESVTVNVIGLTPEVLFPADPRICFNGSLTLNEDPIDGVSYVWRALENPSFSSTEAAPTVSPDSTTTYEVVASIEGCDSFTDSVTVEVIEQVNLTLSPLEPTICQGEAISLLAVAEGGDGTAEEFEWTLNGVVQPETDATLTLSNLDVGLVDIVLTYTNSCETIIETASTQVFPSVVIDSISVDIEGEVELGTPVQLRVNYDTDISFDMLTFNWEASSGEMVVGDTLVTVTPTDIPTTLYTVEIIPDVGADCGAEALIEIDVKATEPEVPNVFTPNNDQTNDFFSLVIPTGAEDLIQITDFKIYSRFGTLVYDNDSNDIGWDGTYNGTESPVDVYIYKISWERQSSTPGQTIESFTKSGDVTLLR